MSDAAPTLPSVAAALAHLARLGYACSQRKLFYDQRKGRLEKHASGGYRVKDLEAYGKHWCKLAGGGENVSQRVERLQREKLEEEVRKYRADAERREVELARLKGALVERARVEQELAARAAVLRADFETWCHEAAVEVCAKGDWHVAELQEWMVEQGQDWFERYADDREFVAVVTDG